jgi:serpin B
MRCREARRSTGKAEISRCGSRASEQAVDTSVYFNGTWVSPFSPTSTRNKTFFLEAGGEVDVPLMHQKQDDLHMHAEGWYQAVELNYRGGDLAMLLLLPDRKDRLADLERALSTPMLNDCVARMQKREIELYVPRFTMAPEAVDLREQLAALGMPDAFDNSRADFSGIDGRRLPEPLFMSSVLQKAFLEVDEKGTRAAAATHLQLRLGLRRVFRADRPFLFAIRDRRSGTILFLGRLADPRSATR